MLQAARETKTIKKIIYTSSMVALGSTDGYIADENQVRKNQCLIVNSLFTQFDLKLLFS